MYFLSRQVLPYWVRFFFKFSFFRSFLTEIICRHMGISVVEKERGDIDRIIDSLKSSVKDAKASM
jgi:hypothetical protein